jgi:hypothetical protein
LQIEKGKYYEEKERKQEEIKEQIMAAKKSPGGLIYCE